jgi:hypothetical protein
MKVGMSVLVSLVALSITRVWTKDLTGLSRSQFGIASITLCGAIVGIIFVSL